jgi:RNA methyltransferase, TrmH family
MFPVAKLHELSPRTRMRKIARIIQGMEVDAAAGQEPDASYLGSLVSLLEADGPRLDSEPRVRESVTALSQSLESGRASAAVLLAMNGLRHSLLSALGAEPAEWDMVGKDSGLLDRSGVSVMPITVYLDDIRSPFNVGSIFRTAEAFGAEKVILSPRTPLPTLPRAERTALGATRVLPWEVAELQTLAGIQWVFALETGGTPLLDFAFPRQGVVILGSEELGVSPEGLALAERGLGRVSIPLAGAKRSLNVSVAFGILMQAWVAALSRGGDA